MKKPFKRAPRRYLFLLPFLCAPARPDPYELKEVPAKLVIYVPTHSGKLKRKVVNGKLYNMMPTAPSTYASVVAEKSLPLLFQHARSSFPKGTRLVGFPAIKHGVMQVSLSRHFLGRGFWNSPQKTTQAVNAIVKTAIEDSPASMSPLRVRLLIEGKPIRSLAHLDLRKPLLPR